MVEIFKVSVVCKGKYMYLDSMLPENYEEFRDICSQYNMEDRDIQGYYDTMKSTIEELGRRFECQ